MVNVIIIEQPVALLGFAQLLTWIFLSFIALILLNFQFFPMMLEIVRESKVMPNLWLGNIFMVGIPDRAVHPINSSLFWSKVTETLQWVAKGEEGGEGVGLGSDAVHT